MTSPRILSWLVTLLIPFALLLTAVRLIMTPLFFQVEYRMPGFPDDPYGFSLEERLYWSRYEVNYLLNSEGIDYLGDLRFADGAPVYNERELGHMVDVKNTVTLAMTIWYGSLGLLLLLGFMAWRGGWVAEYRYGLGRGGWLTVFLLGTVLLLAFFAFGPLFVTFHNVFFKPGTWTFLYSDTLIRLTPERFFQDCFIFGGAFSLLGGVLLAILNRGNTQQG